MSFNGLGRRSAANFRRDIPVEVFLHRYHITDCHVARRLSSDFQRPSIKLSFNAYYCRIVFRCRLKLEITCIAVKHTENLELSVNKHNSVLGRKNHRISNFAQNFSDLYQFCLCSCFIHIGTCPDLPYISVCDVSLNTKLAIYCNLRTSCC